MTHRVTQLRNDASAYWSKKWFCLKNKEPSWNP